MSLAPLGGKALRALPILCPDVKPTCPPVQNLIETTAVFALNSKLVGVTFQMCQHEGMDIWTDRQTDRWMDRRTDNFVMY